MKNNMEARGQVTIFIIVAVVIVAAVLIFFLSGGVDYFSERSGKLGFEGCVEDVLEEEIGNLEGNAGFVRPDFSYSHDGKEFVYLCYSDAYYKTCSVQVPFLKNTFDKNLEVSLRDKINACYDASLESLRGQGYDVSSGDVVYNVEIEPGVVRVEIDAPTSVGDVAFSRFNVELNSPLYDILMISTSLVQFEAKYGDSDVSEIMFYYPDYYIEKLKQGDGTTLYSVKNKVFGDNFRFASRSLVWPAGYSFGGDA